MGTIGDLFWNVFGFFLELACNAFATVSELVEACSEFMLNAVGFVFRICFGTALKLVMNLSVAVYGLFEAGLDVCHNVCLSCLPV